LIKNGVIFGAEFNSDLSTVIHSCTRKYEDLKRYCGSKYLQSEVGYSYTEANKYLNEGRYVLYTGTPCQIAGLRAFLRQDYEQLYTMDFVCHGVASRKIFQLYLRSMNVDLNEIDTLQFRDKSNGYQNGLLKLKLKNGIEPCNTEYYKSSFGFAFANNIISRPSCGHCIYASKSRTADFTVADYIGDEATPFERENGVSIITINTPKAKEMFEHIKTELSYREIVVSEVLNESQHLSVSAYPHANRKAVFRTIDKKGYEFVEKKFFTTYRPEIGSRQYYINLIRKHKNMVRNLISHGITE